MNIVGGFIPIIIYSNLVVAEHVPPENDYWVENATLEQMAENATSAEYIFQG